MHKGISAIKYYVSPSILKWIIKTVICLFITFSLLLINQGVVKAEVSYPAPVGLINDYENIISNDQELENKLYTFNQETGIEFTVVTVSDFGGTYLEDYANNLFNTWGIGDSEKNDGLLLLVSSNQRESRIEIGYGLEGRLTDSKSGRIQDEYMIPYFKEGKYSEGINSCVDALIAHLKSNTETTADIQETDSKGIFSGFFEHEGWGKFEDFIYDWGWTVVFFGYILIYIMNSTKSWWLGLILGVFVGLAVGIAWFRWWGVFVLPVIFGIAGLIIDMILSVLGPRGIGIIHFGRSGGGSSRSGGSFGGFSGGSSGGGGSSRSW